MIYHVLAPLQLTEAHLMNSESHKSGVAILGDRMQSPQYVFIKSPPPRRLSSHRNWESAQ